MVETSTMSSKGQVVIPKRVRNALQASSGSRIGFKLKGEKAEIFVVRRKTATPEQGYGLLKGKGRGVPLHRWDVEFAKAAGRGRAGR